MKVYIEVNGHGEYWVHAKDNHRVMFGPFDNVYDAYDTCGDYNYEVVH